MHLSTGNAALKTDCVLTVLQSTIIPLSERFKEFLLEKIYTLQLRAKSNLVVAGHLLVETMLEETKQFQNFMKLKTSKFESIQHNPPYKRKNIRKKQE